jgi:hypothetical protein
MKSDDAATVTNDPVPPAIFYLYDERSYVLLTIAPVTSCVLRKDAEMTSNGGGDSCRIFPAGSLECAEARRAMGSREVSGTML